MLSRNLRIDTVHTEAGMKDILAQWIEWLHEHFGDIERFYPKHFIPVSVLSPGLQRFLVETHNAFLLRCRFGHYLIALVESASSEDQADIPGMLCPTCIINQLDRSKITPPVIVTCNQDECPWWIGWNSTEPPTLAALEEQHQQRFPECKGFIRITFNN